MAQLQQRAKFVLLAIGVITTTIMHRHCSPSSVPGNGGSLWASLVLALVLLAGLGGTTGVSAQKSDIAVGNATISDTQVALAPAVAVPLLDTSFVDPGLSAERAFVVLTTSDNNKVELPNISLSPCSGDCLQGDAVGGGSYLATTIAKVAVAAVAADGDKDVLAEQAVNALTNKGIDELERVLTGYGPIRNIEITYVSGRDALPKELRVDTMLALLETSKSTLIGQVGLFDNGSVDGAHNGFNLGVGYRHLINNDDTLIGVNVFYDYLDDPTVSRFSVGGELKGDWYDVSANWYSGVRDGAADDGGRVESADGWDIEMAGRVASVPWLEFSGKYYNFDGLPGRDDQSGTDFGVRFEPIPLVGAEARYNIPEDGSSEFYAAVNLKYRFGVPLAEHLNPQRVQVSPVKSKRYDRVRREYQQRLNQHAPPPPNNIGLFVTPDENDGTIVTLSWSWLDLGATQADVRFGQIPIVDDNYSSPGRDPVARSGTTGTTIVDDGLIPGITYQFNVRLFATGSATPITVTDNTVMYTVPGTPPQGSRINARSTVSRIVTGASGTITFDVQPRSTSLITVQFDIVSTRVAQDYTLTTTGDGGNLLAVSSTGGSLEIPAETDRVSLNLVPGSGVVNTANGAFTISVASGAGYSSGDQPSTTVQIAPANTSVASVVASPNSVFESGSVRFTVELVPAPASSLSLSFLIDGMGISGEDYSISGDELVGSNTINFAANQASSFVTLTVVDDSDTAAENLVFTIQPGTGYLPSASSGEAVVRIAPLPLVGISAVPTAVVGGGSSVITISVDSPPVRDAMVVFFRIASTGLANSDFTINGDSGEIAVSTPPSQNSVSILPNQSSAQITLNVPAGSRANGSLVFSLDANSGYNVNNLLRSASVRVVGTPRISVSVLQPEFLEGQPIIITFRADPPPLTPLLVNYTLTAAGGTGGGTGGFTVELVDPPAGAGSVTYNNGGVRVSLGPAICGPLLPLTPCFMPNVLALQPDVEITQIQFTANDDNDGTEVVSINIDASADTPASYTVNPASNQLALTVYPALPVISTDARPVVIVEDEQITITLRADAAPTAASPVAVMFMITAQTGDITGADFTLTVAGSTVASVVGAPITARIPVGGVIDITVTAVDDNDTVGETMQLAIAPS
ncbi:MAG: inverse autotransporter beta domain-containing protein, partial [Candidatus Porifericomitaceae bacterium WSBS_2022_MAG_OTU9]